MVHHASLSGDPERINPRRLQRQLQQPEQRPEQQHERQKLPQKVELQQQNLQLLMYRNRKTTILLRKRRHRHLLLLQNPRPPAVGEAPHLLNPKTKADLRAGVFLAADEKAKAGVQFTGPGLKTNSSARAAGFALTWMLRSIHPYVSSSVSYFCAIIKTNTTITLARPMALSQSVHGSCNPGIRI